MNKLDCEWPKSVLIACSKRTGSMELLAGGFKYWLFSPGSLGRRSNLHQFDEYFSTGLVQPPTRGLIGDSQHLDILRPWKHLNFRIFRAFLPGSEEKADLGFQPNRARDGYSIVSPTSNVMLVELMVFPNWTIHFFPHWRVAPTCLILWQGQQILFLGGYCKWWSSQVMIFSWTSISL